MSLVGNLEDLGLGDILQIVSLSRKSGILFITNGEREGKIIFRDGQVVRSFSTDVGEDLEYIVAGSGVVSAEQLQEGLGIFKEKGGAEGLDAILCEKFGLPPDSFDEAKKGQIEKSAYSLFGWASGNFNFELKNVDDYLDKADFFVYAHGLNPQFLAMEGTRLQDELRRDQPTEEAVGEVEETAPAPAEPQQQDPFADLPSEPVDEEATGEEIKALHEETVEEQNAEPPPSATETVSLEGVKRALLLVDDDPNVLKVMVEKLAGHDFHVVPKVKSEAALHCISEVKSSGATVVVVADLIMPRMDGTGMLGGIEMLEILRGGFPEVPVVLMTDHVNREAESRSTELGAADYIDKPKKAQFGSDFDEDAIGAFVENIVGILTPLFEGEASENVSVAAPAEAESSVEIPVEASVSMAAPADSGGLVDLAADLHDEVAAVGDILPEESSAPQPVSSPGISMLKSMIEELNGPEGGRQITLLILRFASELMNRAVIFLVKNDGVEGLGQFGIEIEGELADKRVRATKISKDVPCILKDVLDSQRSVTKKMEDNEGNNYLVERLGGQRPFECFAAPIIANNRVAVIVYCDNLPEDKEIGDVSALDIFLMQAGVAMERALLERRVSEMAAN